MLSVLHTHTHRHTNTQTHTERDLHHVHLCTPLPPWLSIVPGIKGAHCMFAKSMKEEMHNSSLDSLLK